MTRFLFAQKTDEMRGVCMTTEHITTGAANSAFLKSEDWWAVWLGLLIFILGAGQIWNLDLLGWVSRFSVWIDPEQAVQASSKSFGWLNGIESAVITYLFVLVITTAGAYFMGSRVRDFALGFTVMYWITVGTSILGNYA